MLDAGADAPAFELPAHTGRLVRSTDLRGSWWVLWWFPEAASGG